MQRVNCSELIAKPEVKRAVDEISADGVGRGSIAYTGLCQSLLPNRTGISEATPFGVPSRRQSRSRITVEPSVQSCATLGSDRLGNMLKRVHVQGFKSLRTVDVQFAPLSVLFGPNAVGKSNLLEALLLLSRLATERTIGDALGPPLRGYPLEAFSLPEGGLPALLNQQTVELALEADIEPASENSERANPLRYRIAIQVAPATGEARVSERPGKPMGVSCAEHRPRGPVG